MGLSHKISNMEQLQDSDTTQIFLREEKRHIQSNLLYGAIKVVRFVLRGSASVAFSYKLKVINVLPNVLISDSGML